MLKGGGISEREFLRWKDIWNFDGNGVHNVNTDYPEEFESLLPIYDKAISSKAYSGFVDIPSTAQCLRERAEMVISGVAATVDDCLKG